MIAGQYISCDIGNTLHVHIVALMHGTFKSQTDQPFCKLRFGPTVLDKDLHIAFDFVLYVFDAEYFFKAEVLTFKNLTNG